MPVTVDVTEYEGKMVTDVVNKAVPETYISDEK